MFIDIISIVLAMMKKKAFTTAMEIKSSVAIIFEIFQVYESMDYIHSGKCQH